MKASPSRTCVSTVIDVSSAVITCAPWASPSRCGRGRVSPGAVTRPRSSARRRAPRTPAARRRLPGGRGRRGRARRPLRRALEHVAAASQRPLARAPRRVRELVVEADDPQRSRPVLRRGARPGASGHPSLRPPDWCRQGRTEFRPTTCSPSPLWTGSVVSHWRSNSCHGSGEPRRRQQRDVVIARDGQHGRRRARAATSRRARAGRAGRGA